VRPSISLASRPTASTPPFPLLIATIEGSLTTMPLPRAYTQVLAVPRSIAMSLENTESIERRLKQFSYGRWSLVVGQGAPRCAAACRTSTNDKRLTTHSLTLRIGGFGSDLNTVLPGILDSVHGPVRGLHQLFGRGGDVGQC